eukprot:4604979-Pleurochrysis_carterae.AAC.7
MGFLGELLKLAHVRAGRGKASELPAFGLTLLTRKACVAGGRRPAATGGGGVAARRFQTPARPGG